MERFNGVIVAAFVFGVVFSVGCGSSGSSEQDSSAETSRKTGTSIQRVISAVRTTASMTSRVADDAAGAGPSPYETGPKTYRCFQGGTVEASLSTEWVKDPTGSIYTLTYSGDANFNDCNGFTGPLAIDGQVVVQTGNVVSYSVTDGELEVPGCVFAIDALRFDRKATAMTGGGGANPLTLQTTISGGLRLQCASGEAVICAWNGVDVADAAAIEAGCAIAVP